MFLKSSNANVIEIGLGEGVVIPREDRLLVKEAKPMVEALRTSILQSKLSGFTMGHKKSGKSITVHAKFTVAFGNDQVNFSVHVMKDGIWAPGSIPSVLKVSKIEAAENLVKTVAAAAFKFSRLSELVRLLKPSSMNEWIQQSPEDRVRKYLFEALYDDIEFAESRLRTEVLEVLRTSSARSEALSCWEGAVRNIVHKALKEMDGLPPEFLHRLVDEMYLKEIHNA